MQAAAGFAEASAAADEPTNDAMQMAYFTDGPRIWSAAQPSSLEWEEDCRFGGPAEL